MGGNDYVKLKLKVNAAYIFFVFLSYPSSPAYNADMSYFCYITLNNLFRWCGYYFP